MKLRRRPRSAAADVDRALTPLIDVVFLLLIFFVCAGSGAPAEQLLGLAFAEPEPSESESAAAAPDAAPPAETFDLGSLWVELKRRDGVTVAVANDVERAGIGEIESLLADLAGAGAAADVPVVLDAADDVPTGDVIRVFDAAVAAGFQTIDFATGPAREN
ncbi:MAG: biopolymer transporter ExbD [Planctomycetota bacterium]